MVMSRVLLAFLVIALCAVFAVPPAAGKEGVRARLDAPLPLAAVPGRTITVTWTLRYSQHGGRRPFDASGLFVRLVDASGGRSTEALGEGSAGRYSARVVVPAGGIARIQFGLQGWTSLANDSAVEADTYFPLENDPFRAGAGPARTSSPAARTSDAGWPAPIWLVAVGSAFVIGLSLSLHRQLAARRSRPGHETTSARIDLVSTEGVAIGVIGSLLGGGAGLAGGRPAEPQR